jgi:hypothetical protein
MKPLDYLRNIFNQPFSKIQLKNISAKEIKKIKSLKTKNSCGYDDISNKILKISTPSIISPLTYICNKSLSAGEFPTHLKYAEVKPLFKSGKNTELSTHQFLFLLHSAKFFGKIMYKRLYHHLNYNNILANEQYKKSAQIYILSLKNRVCPGKRPGYGNPDDNKV